MSDTGVIFFKLTRGCCVTLGTPQYVFVDSSFSLKDWSLAFGHFHVHIAEPPVHNNEIPEFHSTAELE